MRCSAPSPSAAIAIARDRQTASRASANAPHVLRRDRRAACSAVGEHEDGVVGGGVAVDRHLVEAAIDRRPQQRSRASPVSTGASVVRKASIVAICGWIMPEPLAMPPMRITRPSARRVETACCFGRVSVVMIARAACPDAARERCGSQGGDDGLHGGHRKPRADEAGRGREDLVRLAAEMRGSRCHDGARVLQSAGTRPGVRAAGVHDDPTHGRGAGGERLLGQQHRRRPHQVGGEGRRRACRPVGRQQHQVGAARLADAGHADGHREALRGRDPSGDDGCAHG